MNSLPKTVSQQRRACDLNPGPSAPESSTLTTRLPSHPYVVLYPQNGDRIVTTDYVIVRPLSTVAVDSGLTNLIHDRE